MAADESRCHFFYSNRFPSNRIRKSNFTDNFYDLFRLTHTPIGVDDFIPDQDNNQTQSSSSKILEAFSGVAAAKKSTIFHFFS